MIAMSSLMYFLLGEKHEQSPLQFVRDHQLCIDSITVVPSDRSKRTDENRTRLRSDYILLEDHTNNLNCNGSTAARSAIAVAKFVDSDCCMWTVIAYTLGN